MVYVASDVKKALREENKISNTLSFMAYLYSICSKQYRSMNMRELSDKMGAQRGIHFAMLKLGMLKQIENKYLWCFPVPTEENAIAAIKALGNIKSLDSYNSLQEKKFLHITKNRKLIPISEFISTDRFKPITTSIVVQKVHKEREIGSSEKTIRKYMSMFDYIANDLTLKSLDAFTKQHKLRRDYLSFLKKEGVLYKGNNGFYKLVKDPFNKAQIVSKYFDTVSKLNESYRGKVDCTCKPGEPYNNLCCKSCHPELKFFSEPVITAVQKPKERNLAGKDLEMFVPNDTKTYETPSTQHQPLKPTGKVTLQESQEDIKELIAKFISKNMFKEANELADKLI